MRILVVEDEIKLADSLSRALRTEAYAVDVVMNGIEAEEKLLSITYDAAIIDIGLPGKDGISVCHSIRKEGSLVPVMLLTARDTSTDKVRGLDSGADDYVIKPFDLDELLARLRALIRRNTKTSSDVITCGDVELDLAARVVKRDGLVIQLSAKEYAMAEYLLLKHGTIVTKEELLEHVWDMNADPFSKVVDVYIGYLRSKIDKPFPSKPPLIQTVRGMGYRVGE